MEWNGKKVVIKLYKIGYTGMKIECERNEDAS